MAGNPPDQEDPKGSPTAAWNADSARTSTPHWLSPAALSLHAGRDRQLGRLPEWAVGGALEVALSGSFMHTHHGPVGSVVTLNGRSVVAFSTANYLGFAAHPEVIAAAQAALAKYGTSMCVGRVSDQTQLQLDLELALAAHLRAPAVCVVASGYVANVAVFAHLFGPRDLVVHDRHMHASMLEGWRLSRARRHSFPHNDLDALAHILAKRRKRAGKAIIVVEGLYSVEGDITDLPRLVRIARAEDCMVAIDESHSLGVLGSTGGGLAEHWGVPPEEIDLRTGSLGKSLAASAGFFAGSAAAVQALQLTAPTVVLSTGPGIASLAVALASLGLLHREPERLDRLREASRAFRAAATRLGLFPTGSADSPIASFAVGDEAFALNLARRLLEEEIVATPFVFPAVPRGHARLRFMITAEHSDRQLLRAAETLARAFQRLP